MDIDKIVDEVVRRLMLMIEQEQGGTKSSVDVVSGATTVVTPLGAQPKSKKRLITEVEAASVSPGSSICYPKGTIITPLAKDVFKQRKVTVEIK